MSNRKDGLSEQQWREFEQLKFSKTPELKAEFGDDFESYWQFCLAQNDGRVWVAGGTCSRYAAEDFGE